MRSALWLVLVGVGCGGDPTCKEALTNAANVLDLRKSEITTEIGKCEQESWSAEVRRCLANAKDKHALAGCPQPGEAQEPRSGMKKAKKTEALVQLDKIGKRAIEEYVTNATFPTAAAPLTPSTPCCTQNAGGKRKCAVSAADWSASEWRALDFSLDKEFQFQYSYTPGGGGTTFVAQAVGDLDCDGTAITYEIRGEAAGGMPTTKIFEPPPNAD
jgi:hypothetical protein